MSDRIRLVGLRSTGFHGVLAAERRDGQVFGVDAELELDVSAAAATDDLRRTADYGALAQRLQAVVRGEPVNLIETLALRLVAACLGDPRVLAATVTVHKPHAPIPVDFADVAVTLRRQQAVLSLGSNIGDRFGHLKAAVTALGASFPLLAVSPVYETAPVGGPDQDPYLNAVVLAAVPGPTEALLAAQAAENARGRTRQVRFGPRTLDVDVVAVAGERSADPSLLLPHPRAHERAFVLAPWQDVAPHAVLAGRGRVAELLEARLAAGEQVARRPELTLV
ncbi:MAG TPA: 2-amino-4-hydroxy-6-hydroxymethyldihydropteridine diphosphokinase [Mycobacteriales bacterium]|nr:2-amino-4-hydroxy-6-hydroxymethyldihydropteridine diphosphokinase [Mycobacteriales bacterium]